MDFCYLPESEIKMTIVAANVNKTSVVAANWTTTCTFTASMLSSSTANTATSSINIVVVPCAITEAAITNMTTAVSVSSTNTHTAFTYTNSESTVAVCGAIVYELVGGNNAYLSYNTSTRVRTLLPTSNSLEGSYTHTIKAKAANFPLNVKYKNFIVTVTVSCVPTSPANTIGPLYALPANSIVDSQQDSNFLNMQVAIHYKSVYWSDAMFIDQVS